MTWAALPDGRDFIMRPIDRGYCTMIEAKNGSLDLVDFADMNDAISVRDENERRAMEATRRG